MTFRLLLLLVLSATVISCKQSGVPSVVMMPQPLHKGDPSGPLLGSVDKGGVVYYLGEMSADSMFMKINHNGNDGWITSMAVMLNTTPAIVAGGGQYYFSPDSPNPAASLPPGTIVAVESEASGRSHIFYSLTYGQINDGWIATTDLTNDPEELAFAVELGGIADYEKSERSRRYAELFAKRPGSPLISEVSIDLSEITDEAIAGIQNNFPVVIDKANGKLRTVRSEVESSVTGYGDDILGGAVQYSFAEIRPRSVYYQRIVTQLPAFVSLPSVSDYAQYIDKLGDEQSWKAYLLYRVDRSPENIRKLYDAYGAVVRQVASRYPIGAQVRDLMKTYDHIRGLPNYKKVCADISAAVARWDEKHKVDGGFTEGGFILESQRSVYERILDPSIMDNHDVTSGVWYHSFWVRRFAEGNAEVVYSILQDLSSIEFASDATSDPVEEYNDAPDEDYENIMDEAGEEKVSICTFQDYTAGDCAHMLFDCDDYGDADVSQLTEEDSKLWGSLYNENSDGPNPAMVGKRFRIVQQPSRGEVCNEGQGGEGPTMLLVSFTLVED